jgi:alpha-tubulin suppressor-like RCC1 family protein
MPALRLAALTALLLPALATAAPAPAPSFDGQLSGHASHACFLRPTRDVVCWGLDLQHAQGVVTPSGAAALVPGLAGVEEIAVGSAHGCAIKPGGQVACWGYNGQGQLGTTADKTFRAEPADVPGVADAIHLASSGTRTCAVHRSGEVACWGSWDPSATSGWELNSLIGLSAVSQLVMGDTHACALWGGGKVACWGDGALGQVGNGRSASAPFAYALPEAVVGLDDAVHLSASGLDTCAVKKSGAVVCWGGHAGALTGSATRGRPGAPNPALAPVAVPGVKDAERVLLTDETGCITRKKSGQLACWGPLFAPWTEKEFEKSRMPAPRLTDVKEPLLARGTRQLLSAEETYALVQGGKVLHWGGRSQRLPVLPVKDLSDAVALSTGTSQSCAVKKSGAVVCWGAIGTGLESSGVDAPLESRFSSTPVPVAKVKGAVAVAVGAAHACALDKAGAVWCWGNNAAGQLGTGKKGAGLSSAMRAKAKIASPVPPAELMPREPATPVKLPTRAIQIAAGGESSCAVLEGGALSCWGAAPFSPTPTTVAGVAGVTRVAVGEGNACVAEQDGSVRCWGRDRMGLAAEGTEGEALATPTRIADVAGAIDVAIADGATCAILKDGSARCWGRQSRFLGEEPTEMTGVAKVAVHDGSEVAQLAMGMEHRCLRRKSGALACWGRGFTGAVGDGTRTDRFTPVAVVGLPGVDAVSAGTSQSCAIRGGGEVICWGAHASGGLGDGRDPTAPSELKLTVATAPPAPAPKAK